MSVILNRYLQMLTEASKKDTKKKDASDDPADDETTPAEQNAEEDATDDNPEGGEEETNTDDDAESGDETETEDEGGEENEGETEDNNEESGTEGEDAEGEGNEDDFSLDPDGGEGEDDNSPPPDGLTDPDDDGSNDDTSQDEGEETNVQTNVLNLSKLDRLLMKRRCLSDFYDLRTSINTFRNIIEKNEASIDPTVRETAVRDLNQLYTTLEDYLMYKFSYTNYEENLQNYLLFMRSMNDIVKTVDQNGQKSGKKS